MIVRHTPLWVWCVFVVLLYCGVSAMKVRKQPVARVLALPILFTIWGLLVVFGESNDRALSTVGLLVGLLFGICAGYRIWRGEVFYNRIMGLFEMKGSSRTLILLMATFAGRFAFSAGLALDPLLMSNSGFLFASSAFAGVMGGVFWGRLIAALRQT